MQEKCNTRLPKSVYISFVRSLHNLEVVLILFLGWGSTFPFPALKTDSAFSLQLVLFFLMLLGPACMMLFQCVVS